MKKVLVFILDVALFLGAFYALRLFVMCHAGGWTKFFIGLGLFVGAVIAGAARELYHEWAGTKAPPGGAPGIGDDGDDADYDFDFDCDD